MQADEKKHPITVPLIVIFLVAFVLTNCRLSSPGDLFNNDKSGEEEISDNEIEESGGETERDVDVSEKCEFSSPEAVAENRFGELVLEYFRAINNGEYEAAYDLLSEDLKTEFGGFDKFRSYYADHVKCVRVVEVRLSDFQDDDTSASLGIQTYYVEFEAEYSAPFVAGGETLPMFYKLHCDPHAEPGQKEYGEIMSISTGP